MQSVVIPFSGGMDSSVLIYKAAASCKFDSIHTITFDYGQRHRVELVAAEKVFRDFAREKFYHLVCMNRVIDVKFIRDICPTSSLTNDSIATPDIRKIAGEAQPKSYVPFRNQMFLSIALAYAESLGAQEVWHGATAVDSLAGYWDAAPEYLPQLNALCALNREHKIEVRAPLITSDKADIVRLGVQHKVPFDRTYTCYSGEELADATTPSSSLRIQGFLQAGYVDPAIYKQQKHVGKMFKEKACNLIEYIDYPQAVLDSLV